MTTDTSTNSRLPHLTNLRGLAILGVLSAHSSASMLQHVGTGSLGYWILAFFNQAGRFSPATFLALSGFLLSRSARTTKANQVFMSRCRRILSAYFFWASAIWLATALLGQEVNFSIFDYFFSLITGTVTYQHYYVIVLMQFLLCWLLFKRLGWQPLWLFMALLPLQVSYVLDFYHHTTSGLNTFSHPESYMFGWVAYFLAGMLWERYYAVVNLVVLNNKRKILFCLFLALVLSVFEFHWLSSAPSGIQAAASCWKISSTFYAIFVLLASCLLITPSKILFYLASYSYGIYLIHEPALSFFQINLYKVYPSELLAFCASFAFGLLGPLILLVCIRRYSKYSWLTGAS